MTPSVGRIVHYVQLGTTTCLAAVVTGVVDGGPGIGIDSVSLCIFAPTGMGFHHGIAYAADKTPGTWHVPERVE